MSGQRYVQRNDGAFFDVDSVQTNLDFNYGPGQIVALNVSGFIDPSLLYSLGGVGLTSLNGLTGAIITSGGLTVTLNSSGQIVLTSSSGAQVGCITAIFNGGTSTPALGPNTPIVLNYASTIVGWAVVASPSGSATCDIWFRAGSGSPPTAPNIPTSANKISASAPVTLSGAYSSAGGSSAISTWTTLLSQWGTLIVNLNTVVGCDYVVVQIFLSKN